MCFAPLSIEVIDWAILSEIAQQITKQKTDYILALKVNNSGMQAELEAWWHKMVSEGLSDDVFSRYSDVSSEHGRIETRACQQLVIDKTWLDKKYQWEGLKSIIKVTSDVIEKSTGKETNETRWYISSLDLNAKQDLYSVQSHWQVDKVHCELDMTFREDESRIRKAQGPLVFNVMRKIAMALFKQDKTKKASMKTKKKWQG